MPMARPPGWQKRSGENCSADKVNISIPELYEMMNEFGCQPLFLFVYRKTRKERTKDYDYNHGGKEGIRTKI